MKAGYRLQGTGYRKNYFRNIKKDLAMSAIVRQTHFPFSPNSGDFIFTKQLKFHG
jgi:hypothetical protein